jgi:hypothetical protein
MIFELDASKRERRQPALSLVCSLCVYFDDSKISAQRCKAFPNGIPDEIWLGDDDHTKPYPGDNGIRFERVKITAKA